MKQTAGVITALAVVLAIFGVSNLPKSSPTGAGTAQSESGTKASKARPTAEPIGPYAPCVRIQKRLQPFVAVSPQEPWKLPAFCYPDSKVPNDPEVKASGLDFVIAIVPNPVLTHLPLLFDRLIEIMQQAAQDNQYSYDSAWLPWSDGKEYTRLPDQQTADELQSFQESQPGVLVFRNSLNQQGDSPYKAGLGRIRRFRIADRGHQPGAIRQRTGVDGAIGSFVRRARLENSRTYVFRLAPFALSVASFSEAQALRRDEENSGLQRKRIFGLVLLLVQRKTGSGTARHIRYGYGGRLRSGGPFLPVHRFAKIYH